jgi:hypothetical protein
MAITKLPIDEIMAKIHENVKDAETKKNLIEDIKKIQAELEAEKEELKDETGPKAKNKHVFFVRRDEKGNYSEGGFLAKVPQDSDNNTLLQRIQQASAQQNDRPKSKRGRKGKGGKIEKYYDFFHGIKREYSKAVSIAPAKDLVEIVILPTDEIDFSK